MRPVEGKNQRDMNRQNCSIAGIRPSSCVGALLLLIVAVPGIAAAQQATSGRVLNDVLEPHWLDEDRAFWYQRELRGGAREYILVDTESGTRRPAFDHEALAAAMRNAGMSDADAGHLQLESLEFSSDTDVIEFRLRGKRWQFLSEDASLKPLPDSNTTTEAAESQLQPVPRRSVAGGSETTLTFVNDTQSSVTLMWLDMEGRRRSYGTLKPGERRDQHTFAGHVWEVVSGTQVVGRFQARSDSMVFTMDGKNIAPFREDRERSGRGQRRRQRSSVAVSPDEQWEARVVDGNIELRSLTTEDVTQLTTEGTDSVPFELLSWSPDAAVLAAFRIHPGDDLEVHLVESSPEGGGRAVLHSRRYPLPGDKLTSYELHLFDAAQGIEIPTDTERFDFGRPRIRWRGDGSGLLLEKVDRGHQRFRILEVRSRSGEVSQLFDEQTDTFLWTAHTQRNGAGKVTWLDNGEEFILQSQQDGWRHLYLHDAIDGSCRNQITQGEWVVRGVDRIDEERRQIWFRASGLDPDQDPYLIHYCRIDFDGSHFTRLTQGNGNHSVRYSPGGEFLIDTWSRVDLPPVHELRRVSDGSLVCELERADVSDLTERGWRMPEVFSAPGRDGQTLIWGIIARPRDFDPDKRYPVIEDIYAGPHDSHVPKSFRAASRYSSLTDLGFIVVKIDGMGTANRSRAFHEVCWQNLKDAGFPDRIAWMKSAAKKHPELDLTRVGIYGTSAGGQNAAAALLFHGDFYHAAYAACGCHDNRMDKASWNEQWMGYPVGPHYAENSNIDNAHRLQGHLMLMVGEMDTNVPPESTLRFADALIRADKDFDLLVIPGMGHSNGGRYGQRRMREFFVEHLIRDAPQTDVQEQADACH